MPITNHVLVGTNHRGQAAEEFVSKMQPGDQVHIIRDPDNRFDKFAIKVHAPRDDVEELIDIGFLAKGKNRKLAEWMDATGNTTMAAVFKFAGTGKSHVPGIDVETPDVG